jgi:hypothetical protein
MTLPATVTHVLDADSPLLPPGWARGGSSHSALASEAERGVLDAFWQEEEVEVVVLVEGVDPLTSNSLQVCTARCGAE